MKEANISVIVEEILDYRHEYNQIPDELQYAFGLFWTDDSYSEYRDVYNSLKESFTIKKDMLKKVWRLDCEKGLFYKKIDDVIYLDIQGQLAKGVTAYIEVDGTIYPAFEIIKFGENIKAEGVFGETIIKNAVYIKELGLTEEEIAIFGDEPGWRDIDNILYLNKKYTGEPAYFVRADDPNLP